MSIVIFIFGLAVGSFLNCVIYRLESKKTWSFLKGRSFCPRCKHVLAWHDLVPVISFFVLRGKCQYCRKKISWQYPTVELATAVLFLLISLFFNNILHVCLLFLISYFLIIIFVYDLKHFIIPEFAIFSAIIITLLYNFWARLNFTYILAGVGASLFFLLIFLLSKGKWMGFGDVKLAFFMGIFLGWPVILVALFLSFFIGAIIGIILILLKKKGLKSEVPFGPFLILGTYISLFWGEQIINWYMKFIIL